jgi:hypothetical protein
VYPAVFLIHFISAAVILLEYLAFMVQFSVPYLRAGRDSVLYSFILFYLQFSVVYVCYFQMVIQFVINVHFVFVGYTIF